MQIRLNMDKIVYYGQIREDKVKLVRIIMT